MNPHDLKTWIFNHRAAAERERVELRKHPMSGEEAFAAALALLAFDESINGSPFGRDNSVSRREDEQVREAWAKLRARWKHGY